MRRFAVGRVRVAIAELRLPPPPAAKSACMMIVARRHTRGLVRTRDGGRGTTRGPIEGGPSHAHSGRLSQPINLRRWLRHGGAVLVCRARACEALVADPPCAVAGGGLRLLFRRHDVQSADPGRDDSARGRHGGRRDRARTLGGDPRHIDRADDSGVVLRRRRASPLTGSIASTWRSSARSSPTSSIRRSPGARRSLPPAASLPARSPDMWRSMWRPLPQVVNLAFNRCCSTTRPARRFTRPIR